LSSKPIPNLKRSVGLTAPSDEWLTQQQVAQMLGIPVEKVRPVVATLARTKQIKTAQNVLDRRYLLVHRDSVPVVRQAIFSQG
jgi:hypothetical protein